MGRISMKVAYFNLSICSYENLSFEVFMASITNAMSNSAALTGSRQKWLVVLPLRLALAGAGLDIVAALAR